MHEHVYRVCSRNTLVRIRNDVYLVEGTTEEFECGLHVSTLLHTDQPHVVLFVDPHQELLVVRVPATDNGQTEQHYYVGCICDNRGVVYKVGSDGDCDDDHDVNGSREKKQRKIEIRTKLKEIIYLEQ